MPTERSKGAPPAKIENVESSEKECFVVSPIGAEGSATRRRADQVLRYVIEEVVSPLGYRTVRADRIADPGRIDAQLLERVVGANLVIADLTDANPNVFYELAVRHALGKPFVQICQTGEALPFDIQGLRTIFFDHTDLDSVSQAKTELRAAVETVERSGRVETPLSVTVDLASLRTSNDPERQAEAQMLDLLQEIRRSVDGESRNSAKRSIPRADYLALRSVVTHLTNSYKFKSHDLDAGFTLETSPAHDAWLETLRDRLKAQNDPWGAVPTGNFSDDPPF